MRIAKYDGLGAAVDEPLQALQVHPISAAVKNEGIVHADAPQPLDVQAEMVIDGRLDNDFVAGLREGKVRLVQGGNHSRAVRNPLPFGPITVPPLQPALNSLVEGFRRGGVAHDIPLQALLKGLFHRRVRTEIHIGNPHGNLAFLGSAVLDAPGSAAVQYPVKVPALIGLLSLYAPRNGGQQRRPRQPLYKISSFHVVKITKKSRSSTE